MPQVILAMAVDRLYQVRRVVARKENIAQIVHKYPLCCKIKSSDWEQTFDTLRGKTLNREVTGECQKCYCDFSIICKCTEANTDTSKLSTRSQTSVRDEATQQTERLATIVLQAQSIFGWTEHLEDYFLRFFQDK